MRPVFGTTFEPLAPMKDMNCSTCGLLAHDVGHRLLVLHHRVEGDVLGGLGEGEDRAGVLVRDEALRDDARTGTP